MPTYSLTATIKYWPGSFDDKDVRTFEINTAGQFFNQNEAAVELDRLIEVKEAQLQKQGFRTRYEDWKIVQL